MLLLDTNVCVYAMRADSPHHAASRRWLDAALARPERVGISGQVLSAVVRITTHPRIFDPPASPAEALSFCASLRQAPPVVDVNPGSRHWRIFEDLVHTTRARGNDVPDAYLAALAIEQSATWVTADRTARRFPGVRILNPLQEA